MEDARRRQRGHVQQRDRVVGVEGDDLAAVDDMGDGRYGGIAAKLVVIEIDHVRAALKITDRSYLIKDGKVIQLVQ